MFNTQSGPVHLSCPPECRRLSLQLTGEQPVRTSKAFKRVIYYTWAAANLSVVVKYNYEQSFVVLFAKCDLKHQVQPRCWRDRIARHLYRMVIDKADWQSACVTQNCTSLAQILTLLTYCCGNSALLHIVIGL